MGLLGNTFDDPQTMATLQLAAGLLGSGSLGDQASRGLQGYQASMAASQDAKMRQMQMDNMRKQAEMQLAAEAAAQRKRAALPSIFTGGQQALSPLMGDSSIGMLPSHGRAAVAPSIDVQKALAADFTPEEIQKLDALRNIGMDEVARTITGMQDGREVEQQYDKYGRPSGQGVAKYRAPIEVATGDQKQFVDPYTLKPQAAFTMQQSPDSRASNALGWANNAATIRGQNMADERARETINQGKLPPGYRMNPDGSMSAIPGGPADIKNSAESLKKVSEARDVLGLLDEADKLLPKATGGYIGTGVDTVLGAANIATEGAKNTAQLKAIEGALISKMPKMTGPQSDKDVLLYRQMAGQVADSTLPVAQRQAASGIIRKLNEKYAGMQPGESAPNLVDNLPKVAPKGARARDTTTGKVLVFNGMQWKPE